MFNVIKLSEIVYCFNLIHNKKKSLFVQRPTSFLCFNKFDIQNNQNSLSKIENSYELQIQNWIQPSKCFLTWDLGFRISLFVDNECFSLRLLVI